jgi:hypothetical protein
MIRDRGDKSQWSVEADRIGLTVDEQNYQGPAELMGMET